MTAEDEHIIEAIGKTKIVIRNGTVVEVGTPLIDACPLAARFSRPVPNATPEAIRENIEHRIRSFGMCTKDRILQDDREFVGFGASELLASALSRGLLGCAVIVCDGAGTVIADRSSLVQGIGGRMSGLVSTSPIPGVIEGITRLGGRVVYPEDAKIDPVGGVEAAYSAGYCQVAVTVAGPDEAEAIRSAHPDALIVGVHLTGVSEDAARRLVESCDIVSACASRSLREYAGGRALLQAGVAIPVFALTRRGKEIVLDKILATDSSVVIRRADLPVSAGRDPEPLC
jgi:putative methanogenesis marker protein 8